MKKWLWLFGLCGLCIVFLSSCRKEEDAFVKDEYQKSLILAHRFAVEQITADDYNNLKAGLAVDYLEDGDTMYYKVSNFLKITGGTIFANYVFNWGDGTSTVGHVSGADIIAAHVYQIRNGLVDFIISADSADVTLVDTIHLVCSDEYPFNPVNLNQIVDTSYSVGGGSYHCEWSWLSAWNTPPTGTMVAHGCLGGSNTWVTVDDNVVNSTEHSGYVTVSITAKNSNVTPSPLGNIYWFVIHTTNNQWFTTNAERMGEYYLDTIINGETQRLNAIGFIFIDGVPLPLSYVYQLPAGVIASSNDNKVMEDEKNIFINFDGLLGENKFIRAINGVTRGYEDVLLPMYGVSMYAQAVKDSISFQAGGLTWIMIQPGVESQLIDITGWSLYNEDLESLVFATPMNTNKSGGMARIIRPTPQQITQLVWEIKYKN
jgi:hypothetical protein